MFGVASTSEIAFVGMLFFIVLIAPKVPRIGEALGRRFGEKPGPREGGPDA